ncbi:NAD-dependent epimerase/dehydratase family protein, partial [Candidatus Pelagibacter sp.]|nr:NAD-dependent epimerase/dehydratase family protein [Candidatus Pelagibacter sp.]
IINNIFKSLHGSKISSFIGIGSQAEYGPKEKIIKETLKLKPITTYGKTKVKVYNLLKNNCKNKKIRFVWLRLFSGYGPGSTMKWIIPRTIQSLINNKEIKFTAGEQIYNFIYISDIVSAIVKSLFNTSAKGAYNLAHKESYKIKYVINLIYFILRINKVPSFGSIKYRKDQIMSFIPSISKIKKDLNWQPKVGIKEGLKKNVKFLKKINKVT